ncbi:MAG: hypothetical protein JSV04_02675 [Candidatus Heimdallarchaeota archaeon]|nr:MAG: hypothetical protein JSV04_02675 [Candidatus Heimdallarchaeota archaeon]
MFSVFFIIALTLVTVPIISNNFFPNRYGYIVLFYAIILAFYTVLVSMGVNINTEQGLSILATGQKIVIYFGFLCVFVLAFGAFKKSNRVIENNP